MKPYNRAKTTKGEEVREMFDNIAPSYDRLNHILSMQIDRLWRRRVLRFVRRVTADVKQPRILDLATGTGDLAIALAHGIDRAKVVGADPSQGMLAVAQQKIEREGLGERMSLRVESAEALSFDDDSFDVVSAAFGVRNFTKLEQGLQEMIRVTNPGGWIVVLEFSTPENRLFNAMYKLYSRQIMPRIGALISRDRAAYEYLPASIEEFAQRKEFVALLEKLGLDNCRSYSQSFGIAQIYVGQKK